MVSNADLWRPLLETWFPGLREDAAWDVTSDPDRAYNCIAWAAGDTSNWWWPDPPEVAYWPRGVPRAESVAAFVRAFSTLGFECCDSGVFERGCEKVALFVDADDVPTHAARQLPTGRWTSKLGEIVDIDHELQAVSGYRYGQVAAFLRRGISVATPPAGESAPTT